METAQTIAKLGFKRWYERQLIESHAYLTTCFLCMILLAVCVEEFSFRAPGLTPIWMLAVIGAAGAVGWASWQRYKTIMAEAERLSYRSTCEGCGTYAKFDVLDSGESQPEESPTTNTWLRVRCRKCGHPWTMP
jgi:hypothetical protein